MTRINTNPTFPEWKHSNSAFRTNIRKLHNGIWYLIPVESYAVHVDPIKQFNDFLSICYKVILFGIVNPELKDSDNNDVYLIDDNQQSEQERLYTFKL